MLEFDIPKEKSSIIKVIGVGGGGSNAVNYMYSQGITGVNYVICNTDAQALEASPVPNRIQLGVNGLGAGAIPEKGKQATEEALDSIEEILQTNTEMVFITAGMGGGTGTGGAPVIAKAAKDMGILTVAIVTMPFKFEGKKRRVQAEEGVRELRDAVDAILVISNDKLREMHGNLKMSEAFSRADNVLLTAAKGIAEIITIHGGVNVDFNDVNTIMRDSGVALMGTGIASGPNRSREAIESAMNSPLLNDNDIYGAKYILLNVVSGDDEITMDELGDITDFIQDAIGVEAENVILGVSEDNELGDNVSITLIATGFESTAARVERVKKNTKVIHNLGVDGTPIEEAKTEETIVETPVEDAAQEEQITFNFLDEKVEEEKIEAPKAEAPVFELMPFIKDEEEHELEEEGSTDFELKVVPPNDGEMSNAEAVSDVFTLNSEPTESVAEQQPMVNEVNEEEEAYKKKHAERLKRLESFSLRFKTEEQIEQLEKEPAYMRKNIELNEVPASDESEVSRFTLNKNDDGVEFGRNSFLHDNVD